MDAGLLIRAGFLSCSRLIAAKKCSRDSGLFRYGMLKSPSEHGFHHNYYEFAGRKPSGLSLNRTPTFRDLPAPARFIYVSFLEFLFDFKKFSGAYDVISPFALFTNVSSEEIKLLHLASNAVAT